jgi:hypothetical protein
MIHNSGAPGHSVHIEDIHSVWSPRGTCTPAVEMSMVKDTTIKQGPICTVCTKVGTQGLEIIETITV